MGVDLPFILMFMSFLSLPRSIFLYLQGLLHFPFCFHVILEQMTVIISLFFPPHFLAYKILYQPENSD